MAAKSKTKSPDFKKLLLVFIAAVLAVMTITPVSQFLFSVVGNALGDRYTTIFFIELFYFGTSALIGFFIGVILGWFTKSNGVKVGLVTALCAIVIESIARYYRHAAAFSASAVVSAVFNPKLFLFNYLLLFVGFVLGTRVGNKALAENHRIRLYVFGAFLLLLIVTTQIFFWRAGLELWNPLSKMRGVF